MILTQVIETGIRIDDCIAYAQQDNLLAVLKLKFEKRCYHACYILTINRIIKRSECVILQEDHPDAGVVHVVFEAEVLVYSHGEVITGCQVIERCAQGIIVCSTPHAYILMASDGKRGLESITKGQLIPCIVGAIRYDIGSTAISISARAHTLESIRKSTIYHITGDIDKHALANIRGILSAEQERLAKMPRELVAKFSELMYPYNKPPAIAKLGLKFSDEDLKGYIAVDPRAEFLAPLAHYTDEKQFVPDAVVSPLSSTAGAVAALNDRAQHIRLIREMCEVYGDKMPAHDNLWKYYAKNKV